MRQLARQPKERLKLIVIAIRAYLHITVAAYAAIELSYGNKTGQEHAPFENYLARLRSQNPNPKHTTIGTITAMKGEKPKTALVGPKIS